MGMFATSSPGVGGEQGEPGANGEQEEAPQARFPEPPARSYRLAELLRLAGYEEQASAQPGMLADSGRSQGPWPHRRQLAMAAAAAYWRRLSPSSIRSTAVLQAASAPDVDIRNILTCNSISGGEDSLYVCVPSADGQCDGHDWADEVRPSLAGVAGWAVQRSAPCWQQPLLHQKWAPPPQLPSHPPTSPAACPARAGF